MPLGYSVLGLGVKEHVADTQGMVAAQLEQALPVLIHLLHWTESLLDPLVHHSVSCVGWDPYQEAKLEPVVIGALAYSLLDLVEASPERLESVFTGAGLTGC